ncbi:MAG: DUF3667 domain-containing protein [Burkholderiales bacterium]|nr:DUF3667 domain-containing protein [Burkholderiales bacterium]
MSARTRRARAWPFARRARAAEPARPPGETACRNCGAEAPGAWCPACGQETTLALPKAGVFMREAAGRYVAFDGTMWRTLALLATRPGHLTREYLTGRRARYVRPARLVLVLAIVLFAAIRITGDDRHVLIAVNPTSADSGANASPAAPAPRPRAGEPGRVDAPPAVANAPAIDVQGAPLTFEVGAARLEIDENLDFRIGGIDSPLARRIAGRFESFNRLDRDEKLRAVVAGMVRFGPYALVAMLPVFALLMQVLYLGRAQRYPGRPRRYAEHLVYGAHNHAFVALAATLGVVVDRGPASLLLSAWVVVYLVVSMHVVYGGRWAGVFVRSAVASIAYALVFLLATGVLLVAAVLFR